VFLGVTGVIYFTIMHGINSVKECIVILWKLSAILVQNEAYTVLSLIILFCCVYPLQEARVHFTV